SWWAPASCSLLVALFFVTSLLAACSDDGGEARAGHEVNGALVATADHQGSFNTPCAYSHSADDDPIVHAGMARMSHRHDFCGAVTTSSTSTARTLLAGGTNCRSVADHSAYWAPSLLSGGVPIAPLELIAYYRVPVGADASLVKVPPNG